MVQLGLVMAMEAFFLVIRLECSAAPLGNSCLQKAQDSNSFRTCSEFMLVIKSLSMVDRSVSLSTLSTDVLQSETLLFVLFIGRPLAFLCSPTGFVVFVNDFCCTNTLHRSSRVLKFTFLVMESEAKA